MSQVRVVLKSVWDDKGIQSARQSFAKLGSNLAKVGTALGAAAIAVSIRALSQGAKAAVEDAKSQALLAEQLRNTVGANEELIGSVEQSIAKMQMSAAVADDVLRPSFAQLIRATGDVSQATRLMDIALDVSAATGRDVNSVAVALSKAYQGNTTALSRLGIKAEEGTDVFAMLEEQFAGAAETAARNDPFQRLNIIFGELSEQLGQFLIPYLNNIADFFASAKFQTGFAELTEALAITVEQFDIFFKKISGVDAFTFLQTRLTLIAGVLSTIAFAAGEVGETIQLLLQGKWAEAGRNVATFGTQLDTFTRTFNKRLDDARKRAENLNLGGTTRPTVGFTGRRTPTPAKTTKETAKEKAAREQQEALAKARKLIDDANAQLGELQTELASNLAQINADYAKEVAAVNADFAKRLDDIVKQSQDRLRDAYRSVVSVSISDLFGERTTRKVKTEITKLVGDIRTTITRETEETVGGSVNDLVAGLTKKLTDSKQLLENASSLAARGFSQTFIEQVVGAGTDTGNELANAILQATPETQDELKNLFNAVEAQANNGMDGLAKSIYDRAGLATQELKDLYAATQQEQVDALLALQEELQKNLSEANTAFQKAVAELREKLKEDLEGIKGDLTSLKLEIDALMLKLAELAGIDIKTPGVNIPTIPTNTGTGGGGTGGKTGGTTINIITKTDPTKSAAETGKQIARAVNKYTGGGGGLNRGFVAT